MSTVSMHFDALGSEAPSFTVYATDAFAASLLQLWIEANRVDGKDVAGAEACLDAMRNARYLQRKTALEVLDHVPAETLISALSRRGVSLMEIAPDKEQAA